MHLCWVTDLAIWISEFSNYLHLFPHKINMTVLTSTYELRQKKHLIFSIFYHIFFLSSTLPLHKKCKQIHRHIECFACIKFIINHQVCFRVVLEWMPDILLRQTHMYVTGHFVADDTRHLPNLAVICGINGMTYILIISKRC